MRLGGLPRLREPPPRAAERLDAFAAATGSGGQGCDAGEGRGGDWPHYFRLKETTPERVKIMNLGDGEGVGKDMAVVGVVVKTVLGSHLVGR